LPFEALGVLRTGSANYYRGANEGESEAEFVARRAQELEALILAEGPETIAAMIAEPVSGAGGVIVPPEGYFEAIQAVLDRYGIWLWDDEVICGFGRLGTDFGANKMSMRPSNDDPRQSAVISLCAGVGRDCAGRYRRLH
jgi:adenosylmethionine-8-amino-7-oxononanoate aminotransferase